MDTEIIVISAILVALVFSPFIWTAASGKTKNNKTRKQLEEMARNEGCTVSSSDSTKNFAVGLDEKAEKIFFFRTDTDGEVKDCVDLLEVKSCRIEKEYDNPGNSKTGSLEKVILMLSLQNFSRDKASFTFYNASKTWQLQNELDLALKWESTIKERIKK